MSGGAGFAGAGAEKKRLLVVSHASVLPVNQAVYGALRGHGWEPTIVVPSRWRHGYASGTFEPSAAEGLGGRLLPLPVLLPGRQQRHAYLARPARVLRRLRPDAVLIEEEPFSVSALQWGRAAARAGIPFGVQMDENLDRALPRPARAIRDRVLPRASFVLARSPVAAALARTWGARAEVDLVPHAVPPWEQVPRAGEHSFTVGFAGRLVREKGVLDLVAAARLAGPPVRLLFVGNGPLREELAAVRDVDLELRSDVDHADMAGAYAEMDVLALPSRATATWAEQFGRVLVEALSCAVPVVGSDSGAIPWVVEETGGGLTFPEGDVRALADRLAQLRDDPQLRSELGERGRSAVGDTFGADAVAAQLHEVLDRATARRRPRVALVAHSIHDLGGMERAFAELIRRGHGDVRFVVYSTAVANGLRELVEWKRVPAPARPVPLRMLAFAFLAGLRLVRARADLVHTLGAIVPNRADIGTVQYCHAADVATTGRLAPATSPRLRRLNTAVKRLLAIGGERWCYRPQRMRVLAAVSPGVARELDRHYPGVTVALTPNGVDLERFRPDAERRQRMRAEHGVAEDEVIALFVGGDWDRKGLGVAIEGLAAAGDGVPPLRLWVVGSGNQERFAALARRLGVGERVHFFGPRAATELYFQAADVFVLPTLYETFSLVAYEAAASALPVVATRVSGIEDLLADGEAGVLVARDAAAVGAALAQLAREPELRARMGAAGRERASAFDWDRSARSVLDLYRELEAA